MEEVKKMNGVGSNSSVKCSDVEKEDGSSSGSLLQMHKPLAQLLAHRQWWKVCWVYGDQQKYYRQLYGRKKNLTTLRSASTAAAGKAGCNRDGRSVEKEEGEEEEEEDSENQQGVEDDYDANNDDSQSSFKLAAVAAVAAHHHHQRRERNHQPTTIQHQQQQQQQLCFHTSE